MIVKYNSQQILQKILLSKVLAFYNSLNKNQRNNI